MRFCPRTEPLFLFPTERVDKLDPLKAIRNEIDVIDEEIARLFQQRMEKSHQIAEYKLNHGLPVMNSSREQNLIEHNSSYIEDERLRPYYIQFLKETLRLSRQYQHRLLEGMRVAYSGVEGAFANIASKRIFPDGNLIPCTGFKAAYDSVVNGNCDACVLPIENSYAGEVGQVMDLMFEGPLYVSGVYTLGVSQNLLGVPGTKASDITKVISHPQALDQCAGYISRHLMSTEQADNTARAAKYVAELGDPTVGAIASRETAAIYGLEILDHDINEANGNTTRFAVLTAVPQENRSAGDTFLLMFTVKHAPGALAKAVNIIGDHGFNMRVLRSRSVKGPAWHYYFYVEAEGDETSENGRAMLQELGAHCEELKVLGSYPEVIDLEGGTTV